MELAIIFGSIGAAVVVGLLVYLFVSVLSPRPSARPSILLVDGHPETASNIGRTYVIASGANRTNTGLPGYRKFPGMAFTSGPGGASTLVRLSANHNNNNSERPFSSSSSSSSIPVVLLKSKRDRKSRKARTTRRQ